jgi:hypothetical protein
LFFKRSFEAVFVAGVLSILLVAACSGGDKPARQDGAGDTWPVDHVFQNFVKTVSSAEADGYVPYWLGREFTVGDVVFSGPYVNDYGTEVPGGGVDFNYTGDVSKVYGRGALVSLDFIEYSPAAWGEKPHSLPVDPDKWVTVGGHRAKLWISHAPSRPIAGLTLLLTIDDTTIMAIASSGGSPTRGAPDANPLIDEAAFLATLNNLRPYPD